MADKLEERMRATERLRRHIGMGVTVPDGCKLRNPDGPEAADEITRLNAENERALKALDRVLATSGARGRYHALEYSEAVAAAEALLAQPPVSHDQ